MTHPECDHCGECLEHPQDPEHVMTQAGSMNFAMDCKECGEKNNVWLSVESVKAL